MNSVPLFSIVLYYKLSFVQMTYPTSPFLSQPRWPAPTITPWAPRRTSRAAAAAGTAAAAAAAAEAPPLAWEEAAAAEAAATSLGIDTLPDRLRGRGTTTDPFTGKREKERADKSPLPSFLLAFVGLGIHLMRNCCCFCLLPDSSFLSAATLSFLGRGEESEANAGLSRTRPHPPLGERECCWHATLP